MKVIFYWVLYPLIRPLYLIFLIVNTLVLAVLIILIAPFDNRGNWAHHIGKFWALLNVYLSGTRLSIKGREKIAKGRSYVIMSNHQSLFDVWALIGKVPLQLRWIIKSDIRKIPVFGYALDRMGHIYIEQKGRKDTFRSLEVAGRRIRDGASVAIFPEGTRSEDGCLLRFHRGGTILATMSGVPILPITVNGGRFVLPKGTLALMPGKIQIIVGDLIDPAMFDPYKRDELLTAVRLAIENNLDLEYGKLT